MPIKPGAIYELAKDGRVILEMQDVMDMVADVKRLEWLAERAYAPDVQGVVWTDAFTPFSSKKHGINNWRDAIDEAMRADL